MKKLKYFLKRLVFSLLKCSIMFGLLLILIRDYTNYGISNALFVAGFSFTAVGIVFLISREGVFDLVNYGYRRLFSKKGTPKDPYDYITSKDTAVHFLHTIVTGIVFIIIAYIYTL